MFSLCHNVGTRSSPAHRAIFSLGFFSCRRLHRLWGFQLRPFPSCLNTIASLHCHPQLIASQMPTSPSLRRQQRCRMKTIWKEASPSRGPVGMETAVFVNGGFSYAPGQRFPTVSWSKRTLSDFFTSSPSLGLDWFSTTFCNVYFCLPQVLNLLILIRLCDNDVLFPQHRVHSSMFTLN